MTANIWRDGEIVFQNIDVSMIDPRDPASTRLWEGRLYVDSGENFDVRGHYRLEFDDGKSADIVASQVLGRNPMIVHFRVLAWKERLRAVNGLPESL